MKNLGIGGLREEFKNLGLGVCIDKKGLRLLSLWSLMGLCLYFFCVILVFTQLAFAGVHVWAYTLMELGILVLLGIWVIKSGYRWVRSEGYSFGDEIEFNWPVFILFFCFLAVIGLQLLPLPEAVLKFLSPQAHMIYGQVEDVTGVGTLDKTLSVVAYATKVALYQVIAYMGALGLCLYLLDSRKRIVGLAGLLVFMGLFQVFYGMVQTYGVEQESIWWWPKEYYKGFVTGTYINKNSLAGFLELAIPMAFGLALSLGKKGGQNKRGAKEIRDSKKVRREVVEKDGKKRVVVKKRSGRSAKEDKKREVSRDKRMKDFILGLESRAKMLVWAVLCVNISLGLLLTSSRGGIISLGIAAFFVGILFFFKAGYRKVGVYVLGCCLLVLVYGLSVGLQKTTQRFEQFDYGLEDRLEIFQAAWPIVWDYPVLGSGLDTFEHVFPAYRPEGFKNKRFLDAHNDWLQLAIETGLVGFGIVAVGYVWFLVTAIRQWYSRRDPVAVGVGAGMIMAVVSIGIHSFVDFNMHIPANALSTMVVAGIGWKALTMRRD